MKRTLAVAAEAWPIQGSFRIARGSKTEAHVVVATISDGNSTGHGECVPYARYGETVQSVLDEIASLKSEIESGLTREALQDRLRPGAARNALDCALIDWEAKASGKPAHTLLGLPPPKPLHTALTLSLDEPAKMAAAAAKAAAKGHTLLKLKIAGGGDLERVSAVREAAPAARLIVDANEGWSVNELHRLTPPFAQLGVALIEQPLKADADGAIVGFTSPVPLCADESCHTRADLPRLAGRYTHVNVKLDKAGGLTEALALCRTAKNQGLGLMIGCMVATSLSMAPAALLGGLAEFIDLDGPLLLARDRASSLVYRGEVLEPPSRMLWG